MRIAYLSYSAIPSREANAVHVMKMCQAFARQGHEVTLYARTNGKDLADPYAYYGVDRAFEIVWLTRPPLEGVGHALYGWRVARAVATRPQRDLLYARDVWSLSAAAHLDCPMVLESHNPPRRFIGRSLQARLFRRPKFRRLVVISDALRRDYLRAMPELTSERVVVAHDGADLPAVPPADATSCGGWAGRLQVGYVGHLYQGRGIDVILELARRLPDIDFHIIGGAPHDLAQWNRKAHGIANLFFHGYVPPSHVEAFRRRMDVLLAPYQQTVTTSGGTLETSRWMSPLEVFEYMASRKPIIASDLPVLREVLSHEVNALLVPPADVEAWARAIQTLERGNGLRDRLAQRAYQDVAEQFTWERRARRVLVGLNEVGGRS